MKPKRWSMRLLGGLTLTACLSATGSGCKQPLVMEPNDYRNTLATVASVGKVETDPRGPLAPLALPPGDRAATVLDPTLPAREVSLKECIALALEQGFTGNNAINPGFANDVLPQSTGRGTTGNDAIRAFAIDPSIAAAEVERSSSKFDARLISSVTWNRNDQPVVNAFTSFSNGDAATVSTTIAKPLPTGGVSGITFSTAYNKLANPSTNNAIFALNQSYTPRLQFVFEQPLLQAFGVEVNQVLAQHPGSLLIPGFRTTGVGTEGILITRLRQDQQRAQFDLNVNQMLLNVETAYWNLYAAYFNLAAQEEALKQTLSAFKYLSDREGAGLARKQAVLQTTTQYHQFRTAVVNARSQVLSSERQLRNLIGLRSDAGDRLVPTDEPNIAPFKADPKVLFGEASIYRPELTIAYEEVKARQLDLIAQRSLRRPDLRFLGSYDIAGIGTRLDGAGVNIGTDGTVSERNAFRSLGNNQFNNWQMGLRLDMPFGFRDANGLVTQAGANLKKSVIQLRTSEYKVNELVIDRYRLTELNYALIETNRAGRASSAENIALDNEILTKGAVGAGGANDPSSFVLQLLTNRASLATATSQEFQAIANYNVALARLEYECGTIQRYNNVSINEGPLPAHAQKKAADHYSAREAALKLRERPNGVPGVAPLALDAGRKYLPDGAMPPTLEGALQSGQIGSPTFAPLPPPTSSGTGSTVPTPMPVPAVPAPPAAPSAPRPAAPGPDAMTPRPQLQPGSWPSSFTATGSVVLPNRSGAPAAPDAPLTGAGGLPISAPAPGR